MDVYFWLRFLSPTVLVLPLIAQSTICNNNPCANGGTCQPVNGGGGFLCTCTAGWSGEKCQRPCQDIYKSCERWLDEGRCRWTRLTPFFDINCAVTCKKCVFENSTVVIDPPMPPLLEPLSFLVGEWEYTSTDNLHFPVPFRSGSTYKETLKFLVTDVPMFGTPCFNYTVVATNNDDKKDVQVTNGFLSVKPGTKPIQVSLWTTSNNGFVTVEEGTAAADNTMVVSTTFMNGLPSIAKYFPEKATRTFNANYGTYMSINVEQVANGVSSSKLRYYYKKA